MNTKLLFIIPLLAVSVFLFENVLASSVVTGDENSVAVAMKKTKNLEKALSKASKTAKKHCKKHGKVAKLDRTEKGGKKDKAGVAYFSCVSEGGESAKSSKEAEASETTDYSY